MEYHIVKKGESLWQIAQAHKVSLQALMDANPQLEDPNTVTAGAKIFLPEAEEWKIPEPPATDAGEPQERKRPSAERPTVDGEQEDIEDDTLCKKLAALPRPLIYVVKKGDTLYKISNCFDISLKELLRVNSQIKNPDLISPGDKIFIPRSKNIYDPNRPMPPRPRPQNNTCPYCGRPMPHK